MGIKPFKKITYFLITVCAATYLFSINTASYAASFAAGNDAGNATAIANIDSISVINQIETRIESFDSNQLAGFTSSHNTQSINTVQQIAPYPFMPFEGSRCAAVQSSPSMLNEPRSVTREYDNPLNLSENKSFFIALNLPELAGAYSASVSFYSGGGSPAFTANASGLKTGAWNGVFADISDYDDRKNITAVTISVQYDTSETNISEYVYYMDMMGAFKTENAVHAVKYMSPHYYAGGGTLTATNEFMKFTVNDENPYIETYSFNSDILSNPNTNAIKIKFRNLSDCSAITLYYTTERNPAFSMERSHIAASENNTEIQTCYFPIGTTPIEQLKIVFNGATSGDLEIFSMAPASAYIPTTTGYGTVDECVISSNKREINISGTLMETAYDEFKGMKLELFALNMNDDPNIISTQNITPAAQGKIERSFRFKLPINNNALSENYVCSKFVVAASDGNMKIIIDIPKFITNPEILSVNKRSFNKPAIKKGLNSYLTAAQISGAKNTYVTIMLNRLVTLDDTAGYQHKHGGYNYYFSKEYTDTLDATLKSYYNAGITVSAIINLLPSADEILNRILIHPDADRDRTASGYALNTETFDGIRYLRAAFDFLARRYSTDDNTRGNIANYIIGNKAGNAYQRYNMGRKTLRNFADSYACAVRLAYNTVRSVNSSVNVYISLDSKWDEDLPSDSMLKYDNRALIDSIAANFKGHGDINWNLAFDPAPDKTPELYKVWEDENSTDSYDSDAITAKNIETLCRYMSRQVLCYASNAVPRSIILIEQDTLRSAVSEEEAALQTVNFIYSYYKINTKACSNIESYIVQNKTNAGYNAVFKYIDSAKSFEYSEFAKAITGVSEWSDIISGFDANGVVQRNVSEIELKDSFPVNIQGSSVLWDFTSESDASGWSAGDYCGYARPGNTLADRSRLLRVQLTASPIFSEYRGIINTFDFATNLSYAPYISFDVHVSMLPVNVTETELAVLLYSGDNYIEAKGIISAGEWNTVVLAADDFPQINSADCMKIWLRGNGGYTDIGEPLVFISNITISSAEHTDDEIAGNLKTQRESHLAAHDGVMNMQTVWILTTVIIIASTLLAINILTRRSGRRDTFDGFE